MKRTTLSLAVLVAVLAVVVGLATVTRPSPGKAEPAKAARHLPVQRSEAVCPQVRGLPVNQAVVSAFSPGGGEASAGEAAFAGLDDRTKSRGKTDKTGTPFDVTSENTDVPPLAGVATGGLAPGFSAQQTLRVTAGPGRGLSGVVCDAPLTDGWFVGTSTAPDREAYINLANSENTPAVVDVSLFGPDGPIEAESARGITLAPGASEAILLKALNPGVAAPAVAVHVTARAGRVSAAVRDQAGGKGADWVPATSAPGRDLVVSGLPGDATAVQLVAFAPGGESTDVEIAVAGRVNTFRPAANEAVEVKGTKVTSVDLGAVSKGEAGALRLTATRADVVVGVRVVRGTGDDSEVAFLGAAPALGTRAVAADNRTGGDFTSTVSLTAPKENGKVRLSSFPATGQPATADVDIPAGTTVEVPVPVPAGATRFALLVEPQAGSGPVHASRTITERSGKVQMFTTQALTSRVETAVVPNVRDDMSLLVPQK